MILKKLQDSISNYFKPTDNLSVKRLILLGAFLRVCVAVWNGFFGPSYGAGADANTYHKIALDYIGYIESKGFRFYQIFPYALGMIYDITYESLFFGSLLSCIAWLLSAIVLLKIFRLLSVPAKCQWTAMLIYALLPSSILFTSITLKEAYELLLVNLAVYSALRIFLSRANIYWVLLLGSVVAAGVLHVTLYVFGMMTVIVTAMSCFFRGEKRFSVVKLLFVATVVALIIFFGFKFFTTVTNYKMHQGLAAALESYLQGGLLYLDVGRAFYRTSVDINGITGLLRFIPVSLFQYLFEPMPWRISAMVDLQALFENILRAWLIWMAVAGFRQLPAGRRLPVFFVFISYLLIESVWAVGTLNWGTAIRHHIPAMGLLLVSAFASPAILSYSKEGIKEMFSKKHRVVIILIILSIILSGLSVRAYNLLERERIKSVSLAGLLDDAKAREVAVTTELESVKNLRLNELDINARIQNDYNEAMESIKSRDTFITELEAKIIELEAKITELESKNKPRKKK